MTPGTSNPTWVSTPGPALVMPGSDQRPQVSFPKMANSRYQDKIRRIRQSYCPSHQQFVNQEYPETVMIYWQLIILHRTILPQICSFLLFHLHSSCLPRLTTSLQSNEEFSFFLHLFFMPLSFGTFNLMVLKISDY